MPVLLALAAALTYGVGDYLGGRAARTQAAVLVAATGQIVSLLLLGSAVIVMATGVPGVGTWGWSAFAGVVGALGIAGLYHAFAHGDVSVVAPTSAVVGAIVPVVAGLIIGERPSGLALVGIVIAVTAVALVSGAIGGHAHNTPPRIVALAVGVGACFGLLFVALERADSDSGMWPLVIARFVSVPMLLGIAAASGARPVRHRSSLQIALVAGVFDMAANVLYLLAVRG